MPRGVQGPENGAQAAAYLVMGPVILVLGVLASVYSFGLGLIMPGLPMMAIGGYMFLYGAGFVGQKGVETAARLSQTKTGQSIQRKVDSASSAAAKSARQNSDKARARRVIAQLKEQHAAGAIDDAEFSDRVARVNDQLARDLAQ